MGFGAVPGETGSFLRPSGFLAGREVKTCCFTIPPLSEKPSAGVFLSSGLRSRRFPFPAACVPGVFVRGISAQDVLFPAGLPDCPFCTLAGSGHEKAAGEPLSWSRGGLVPENLLPCHGLDRAEGLEAVQVEILDVAQNAVDVFASFHPLFLCSPDIGPSVICCAFSKICFPRGSVRPRSRMRM